MSIALVLTALVLSAVVSACVTAAVRVIAIRLKYYAIPAGDRWHRAPVPVLGGLGILSGFLVGATLSPRWTPLVPLVACSGAMALLGLVDDFRRLRPSTKLVVQMLVAGSFLMFVSPPALTGSTIADQLLAFMWMVGIPNAFNLLDNMDGLSAGIAAIGGAGYLGLLLTGEPNALTIPVAAFVGAAIGFLAHNFPPASIFMGDTGAFFLGAFLGGASLMLIPSLGAPRLSAALVPMLILLVPIFDTSFVTYTRRRAGRSAMVGGRDHTSHRLVALGVSERAAVLTLYALAFAGALLAIGVGRIAIGPTLALVFLYAMLVVGIGVILGSTAEAPADADAPPAQPLISDITQRRRLYEMVFDCGLLAVAYYAAFRIRFQGPDVDVFFPPFVRSLPVVIGLQSAGLYLAGKYRQVSRSVSAVELGTLVRGLALGFSGSVLFVLFVFRFERFSRGVFLIDALVAWFFLVGARGVTSGIDAYLRKMRVRGDRALVYGAGRGGTLLLRELLQNPDVGYLPVGFIDDDPLKRRARVEGIPVVGGSDNLADVVSRYAISQILVSIRDLDPQKLAMLVERCNALGVGVRRMRFSIDEVRVPTLVRPDQGRFGA